MNPLKDVLRGLKPSREEAIAAQHRWIDAQGYDLAGYVAHYGSVNDPQHHGNGGEAIYAADLARLVRLLDA